MRNRIHGAAERPRRGTIRAPAAAAVAHRAGRRATATAAAASSFTGLQGSGAPIGQSGCMSDDKDSVTGKVQEAVGWLTADREAEAKGKLKRLDDGSDGSDEDAAAAVEQAEKDVRQAGGEYDPAVDGQPVAEDEIPAEDDPQSGV